MQLQGARAKRTECSREENREQLLPIAQKEEESKNPDQSPN